MKALDAITKLGCERAANRAILNEAGHRTVIGRIVDGKWQLTEEGEKRAKAFEPAPKKRAPKAKPVAEVSPSTETTTPQTETPSAGE